VNIEQFYNQLYTLLCLEASYQSGRAISSHVPRDGEEGLQTGAG